MVVGRFTRLTNAFSKELKNHKAAVSLHASHYNFCHVYETIRITLAMELGIANHIWSIEELIEQATQAPKPPIAPSTFSPT